METAKALEELKRELYEVKKELRRLGTVVNQLVTLNITLSSLISCEEGKCEENGGNGNLSEVQEDGNEFSDYCYSADSINEVAIIPSEQQEESVQEDDDEEEEEENEENEERFCEHVAKENEHEEEHVKEEDDDGDDDEVNRSETKNVNEEDHKEEGNGEEEESILSRLAGFVTKLLSENRPKERLNQEEALKALNEMGFEDNALNRDILEESRTLQEAVCKLLEK